MFFCDSGVIAHYFVSAISKFGGIPEILRTDCGTENVNVAAIQTFLRHDARAHVYGTSPSNQRIEAWWAFLRRGNVQWWMELFHSFVDDGIFHVGHVKETDCLRFCFMAVLRRNLHDVIRQWNTHRIRPSAGSRCPPGAPDELYYFPPEVAVNCLHSAALPLANDIMQSVHNHTVCADTDFGNYIMYVCQHHDWQAPQSVTEATALYRNLQQLLWILSSTVSKVSVCACYGTVSKVSELMLFFTRHSLV